MRPDVARRVYDISLAFCIHSYSTVEVQLTPCMVRTRDLNSNMRELRSPDTSIRDGRGGMALLLAWLALLALLTWRDSKGCDGADSGKGAEEDGLIVHFDFGDSM